MQRLLSSSLSAFGLKPSVLASFTRTSAFTVRSFSTEKDIGDATSSPSTETASAQVTENGSTENASAPSAENVKATPLKADREMVNKLRSETKFPISLCIKALVETQNNYSAALEHVKTAGAAYSEERAKKMRSRTTADGVIVASRLKTFCVMAELSCETDFVSRTPEFSDLSRRIVMIINEHQRKRQLEQAVAMGNVNMYNYFRDNGDPPFEQAPAPAPAAPRAHIAHLHPYFGNHSENSIGMDLEYIGNLKDRDGRTVSDLLTEASGKFGEKIHLRRVIFSNSGSLKPLLLRPRHNGNQNAPFVKREFQEKSESDPNPNQRHRQGDAGETRILPTKSFTAFYIHRATDETRQVGKVGCVLTVSFGSLGSGFIVDRSIANSVSQKLARQVLISSPTLIRKSNPKYIQKNRKYAPKPSSSNSAGSTAASDSSDNRDVPSEAVLMDQVMFDNPNVTVRDYILAAAQETNCQVKVVNFARFEVGEEFDYERRGPSFANKYTKEIASTDFKFDKKKQDKDQSSETEPKVENN